MNKLNKNIELIKTLKNCAEQPLVDRYFNESQVQLKIDNTLQATRFKKHPILLNTYLASSLTIRALKKDLFLLGEDGFEDLQKMAKCNDCSRMLDSQFWSFCPHCEGKLIIID